MKRQKNILIVEDEPEICDLMQGLLAPLYEEVIFRTSALDAKEIVSEKPFSLILCDILMPGMSGSDFVTYIRSIGRIEPVIFVTGKMNYETLLCAVRLGVSDVIEKPFKDSDLLLSIDRTLEIDKRRMALYESIILNQIPEDKKMNQKKIIGLLHVANAKK
ncbi:MAG TPA: response regulator [Pseudobdellovibrionaceae bacterium]|nr:response regulator [Pseudobdellovibrionaceae bacterium]